MVNSNRQDAIREGYYLFLENIAFKLGLTIKESKELAQKVYAEGEESFPKNRGIFTLKTWLAKLMVKKTVFILTSRLYNAKDKGDYRFSISTDSSVTVLVPELPLSYRVVYILYYFLHFQVEEIAQIMNIRITEVTDRLRQGNLWVGQ